MTTKPATTKAAWLRTSACATALLTVCGPAAFAQDAPITVTTESEAEAVQQTITVTGSRIPTDPNLVSSIPVQSITGDDFRLSGEISVADIVNDLPALISSTTSENSATGQSALNLRGLGTTRTLTLINGRRSVGGFEGSQAVDIGTIPTSLIERVEVMTGGASALYGADAVTGVVNFILKDNYEGFDLDVSTGISSESDAQYLSVKALFGRNFANDRGNIVVSLDYVDDSALRYGDRDWSRDNGVGRNQANPALRFQQGDIGAGTPNFANFYNFDNTGRYPYGLAIPARQTFINQYTAAFGVAPNLTPAEEALFERRNTSPSRAILRQPTFSISSKRGVIAPGDFDLANLDIDGNGRDDCLDSFVGWNSTLVGTGSFGLAGGCWVVNDDGTVRPYRDGLVAGNFNGFGGDGIEDNFNQGFLIPETDRATINVLSNYEYAPGHKIFGEFMYGSTVSRYGSPLNTFYDLLYGAPENPFIPAQLQGVADATGGLWITRDPTDLGPNVDQTKRETLRFVGGFKGEINDGWQYDISLNHGRFTRRVTDNNFVLLDRFFAAIDVISDANGNPICRSDVDPSIFPTTIFDIPAFDPGYFTFRPGDGQCRPANIWGGPNSISPDAVNFITTTVYDKLNLEQTVFSATLVGDTQKYFSLPGGAIGFAVGAEYREEKSKNQRNPFDLGILPEGTPFTPGQFVSDVSGNGSLGFNAEGQFFNSSGSYDATDVFAEIRVPVLRDVILAHELTLDAAIRYSDYSTIGSTETWKAGFSWAPVQDISFRGTVSQAIRAPNIIELFGPDNPATFRPVDPCDANEIQNAPNPAIRAANCLADGLPATYTDPLSARFLGVIGGNPNLKEETADTITLGLVFRPRFLDRFYLTVDYWDVKIDDVILRVAAQEIVDTCYDSPTFPNAFCNLFERNRNQASPQFGGFTFLRQSDINFAKIEARGIDIAANYSFDIGANTFGIRGVATQQKRLNEFPSPNDPDFVVDRLGQLQRPEWAGNLTLTWDRGPVLAGLRTSYQGKQLFAGVLNSQIENNTFSLENAQSDETFVFDLFGRYTFSEKLEFYGGVNNVADEKPFITEEAWPVSARGRYFFAGARLRM
ncbi:MAG: TonB-dependent receptor domain-containing protein [Hyphomonas sp.]